MRCSVEPSEHADGLCECARIAMERRQGVAQWGLRIAAALLWTIPLLYHSAMAPDSCCHRQPRTQEACIGFVLGAIGVPLAIIADRYRRRAEAALAAIAAYRWPARAIWRSPRFRFAFKPRLGRALELLVILAIILVVAGLLTGPRCFCSL